jgi:hypothetical protein
MKYIIDNQDNRYYSIDQGLVSGLKEIRVFVPYGAKVPYPYTITTLLDGKEESMVCLTREGIRDLMEALLKVI